MTLDFEIPPGWAPHPEAPGWFYKGQKVKSVEQLRETALNRAAHDAAQAAKSIGKTPDDKITSSQHPKVGDIADPHFRELIRAAKEAADAALPEVLAAAVAAHTAPNDAPVGTDLINMQKRELTSKAQLRKLARKLTPMALAQLVVIAADPLQLGATRASAAVHLLDRLEGKAAALTPIDVDLATLPPAEAYQELTRLAATGELSADDVRAYAALIDGRAKGAEARELLDRLKKVEALLDGSQTVQG
ncbi:hypothetical protein ACWIEX_06010 [Bosea sp. NPDC055353]